MDTQERHKVWSGVQVYVFEKMGIRENIDNQKPGDERKWDPFDKEFE